MKCGTLNPGGCFDWVNTSHLIMLHDLFRTCAERRSYSTAVHHPFIPKILNFPLPHKAKVTRNHKIQDLI